MRNCAERNSRATRGWELSRRWQRLYLKSDIFPYLREKVWFCNWNSTWYHGKVSVSLIPHSSNSRSKVAQYGLLAPPIGMNLQDFISPIWCEHEYSSWWWMNMVCSRRHFYRMSGPFPLILPVSLDLLTWYLLYPNIFFEIQQMILMSSLLFTRL